MGFWIFMLIMDLLLPFTMIGFGRYFMNRKYRQETGWKIKGNKEIYPIIIRILGITKWGVGSRKSLKLV